MPEATVNNALSPRDALSDYHAASQNWLALRSAQSSAQLRLAALLAMEEKPLNYAAQLAYTRERLAVLEWQINCAARDSLCTHRQVADACVDSAITAFMQAHGQALTEALAPYLTGPCGLDAVVNVLRTAIVRQIELSPPVIRESDRAILDETGLVPDASMRADATVSYTPARHQVFRDRLNRLNSGGAY